MAIKGSKPEEIVTKLRQVEVHVCEPAWNIDPLAGVIGVQY